MKFKFPIIVFGSLVIAAAGALTQKGRSTCEHNFTADAGRATGNELKAVKVTSKRAGASTTFYVENQELCEITMTFDFNLVNLDGGKAFPHTATFAPGKSEAFTLAPVDASAPWEYSYTNYFKLGSNSCEHDENYVYQLPYAPGATYKVTQAANGSYSHKGSNKYAIDWKMPEGTVVCAARGGLVVKVKGDSDKGGPDMSFDRHNNYVLIRHDDGTLGHYCHLQKNGVLVTPGQVVAAGDPIGRSGNTGFSSGPHLHFAVFKTRSGKERESIPIRFLVNEGRIVSLAAGSRYRSPQADTTMASQIDSRGPATGAAGSL
jgi:murein DD-endopeptidase MepM/ murein hydrolase activator NlpD